LALGLGHFLSSFHHRTQFFCSPFSFENNSTFDVDKNEHRRLLRDYQVEKDEQKKIESYDEMMREKCPKPKAEPMKMGKR